MNLLHSLALLEYFDLPRIVLTLECWQHFDYVSKLYYQTIVSVAIMVALKLNPGKVRVAMMTLLNKSSRYQKRGAKQAIHPVGPSTDNNVSTTNATAAQIQACRKIQSDWRQRRAWNNIRTLREKIRGSVEKRNALSRWDFLLLFSYAIYTSLCDVCFMFYDCKLYEDGERYLVADPSIKCDSDRWETNQYYVHTMSILLPLGIPCFYLYTLYKHRRIINPSLQSIQKDKDYVRAFALAGKKVYLCGTSGRRLEGEALSSAQKQATQEWEASNPELCQVLAGQDYKSQFELKRKQVGFTQAREWIKQRARDSNVRARRYRFLWGAYRPDFYWFEVFDIFRRFAVIGLPKVLRFVAPNANIQVYLGLFVMALSPAAYTAIDPYQASTDHRLMFFTQLAGVVVVICAMLLENVTGNLADIVCTAIILVTLLPMFIALLLSVCDPSGNLLRKICRRLPFLQPAYEKADNARGFVRELGKEHPQVALAMNFIKNGNGESEDASSVTTIAVGLGRSIVALDARAISEHLDELLSALGIPQEHIDSIIETLSTSKLLTWCLKPKLEPHLHKLGLEWADVVPVLETIDSIDELREAIDDPQAMLGRVVPEFYEEEAIKTDVDL
jgi:hypothetical protein